VFWNRAAREARRQQVLDELIDLNPEERRLRMDRAVAEGDVRAGEVEQALRIVARLDALRVMRIPGARDEAPPMGAQTEAPPGPLSLEAVTKPSRSARRRVAIEVASELIDVPVRGVRASRRSRAIAREAAVRKAVRAIGGSPRRRRLRLAASVQARTPAAAAVPDEMAAAPAAPFALAAAPETRPEEQRPDISWLRD
jgi:hypothetical protein